MMTGMYKNRCKMASIKNPTIKEEFFKVIKEFKIWVEKEFSDSIWRNFFKKQYDNKNTQLPKIMYKYTGKEIDIMIKHFANTAVYAVIIDDITDTTIEKF